MTSKRIRYERPRKREPIITKKQNEVHRRTRRSKPVQSACLRANSKCPNFPVYLNYSKLNSVAGFEEKSFTESRPNTANRSSPDCAEEPTATIPNSLANCETKSFLFDHPFIHLKIMLILILLSGLLFSSAVLCSFSSHNLESLDPQPYRSSAANGSLPSREYSFVAQKYSASNNSKLFYDLSLSDSEEPNDRQARKPIYFHFISNKPNTPGPIHGKAIHSSSDQIKNVPKHLNRHSSRTSASVHQAYLQRFMLNSDTVKCNDGTEAGYYWRKGKNTKKWIVFLEGGWFCYSAFSCNHQRWVQMRNFMTSAHLPEKKLGKANQLNL